MDDVCRILSRMGEEEKNRERGRREREREERETSLNLDCSVKLARLVCGLSVCVVLYLFGHLSLSASLSPCQLHNGAQLFLDLFFSCSREGFHSIFANKQALSLSIFVSSFFLPLTLSLLFYFSFPLDSCVKKLYLNLPLFSSINDASLNHNFCFDSVSTNQNTETAKTLVSLLPL